MEAGEYGVLRRSKNKYTLYRRCNDRRSSRYGCDREESNGKRRLKRKRDPQEDDV